MATFPEIRGCENCKKRKIRCDKTLPACSNCRKSRKTCVTARFRLSWPRPKDRRRLVVGPIPITHSSNVRGADRSHFLNVTSRHLRQYFELSQEGSVALDLGQKDAPPPLLGLVRRNLNVLPRQLKTLRDGSRTLSYFYNVVADSLLLLPGLDSGLGDLLMKMALRDDGPSSQAVLFSVLSLATLHQQQKLNDETVSLKARSIQALQESAGRGTFTLESTLQHVAAAILLARIEIGLDTNASTLWALFVCGVNTLLYSVQDMAPMLLTNNDSRVLYRHVHYYSTMASFGLRHWNNPEYVKLGSRVEFRGKIIDFKCRRKSPLPELMAAVPEEDQFLSAILELGTAQQHGHRYTSEQHQSAIDELEQRISSAYSRITDDMHEASRHCDISRSDISILVQRRCQVAASWIYLLRTERRLRGPSDLISALLRDILDDPVGSLRDIVSCYLPWPLFIIGVEVSSEEHRRILLDVISRSSAGREGADAIDRGESEGVQSYSAFRAVRELLEGAWAVEDLHAGAETGRYLDYEQKLHSLFGGSEILPALAG